MTDPVVLHDPDHGISYERRALEEWVFRTGYVHLFHNDSLLALVSTASLVVSTVSLYPHIQMPACANARWMIYGILSPQAASPHNATSQLSADRHPQSLPSRCHPGPTSRLPQPRKRYTRLRTSRKRDSDTVRPSSALEWPQPAHFFCSPTLIGTRCSCTWR